MRLPMAEIARRLDLNSETLERWIRQGRIPVKKRGDEGLFNETDIKRWAAKQRVKFESSDREKKKPCRESSESLLISAIRQGRCHWDLEAPDKEAILRTMAGLVPGMEGDAAAELAEQLLARERLTSTGIGRGVAVPHPRNPMGGKIQEPMIVTGFLKEPMEFDAIDDLPVFVIFLLLSPTVEVHLGLLSRLSYCLRNDGFIKSLETSRDKESLYGQVEVMEKSLEQKGM